MEQVCHYCSISTFEEMIKGIPSKDGKYLTFWASSIYAMNDPSEFIYGYEILTRTILPTIEEELGIKDNGLKLSKLWQQLSGINKAKELDEKMIDAINESHQTPFVISFSRQKDFLPMWNTYSDRGKGVCLCFDNLEWIYKRDEVDFFHKLHASDVSYGKVDQSVYKVVKRLYIGYHNRYKDISDRRQRSNEMARYLAALGIISSPYHKHEAYKYEEESRLIEFKDDEKNVKYRCNNRGHIIPYIEVPVKLEYLKQIIVGPCADSVSTIRELKAQLSPYGITDIVPSQIPYREY